MSAALNSLTSVSVATVPTASSASKKDHTDAMNYSIAQHFLENISSNSNNKLKNDDDALSSQCHFVPSSFTSSSVSSPHFEHHKYASSNNCTNNNNTNKNSSNNSDNNQQFSFANSSRSSPGESPLLYFHSNTQQQQQRPPLPHPSPSSQQQTQATTIQVSNLPSETANEEALRSLFSEFGKCAKIRIFDSPEDKKRKQQEQAELLRDINSNSNNAIVVNNATAASASSTSSACKDASTDIDERERNRQGRAKAFIEFECHQNAAKALASFSRSGHMSNLRVDWAVNHNFLAPFPSMLSSSLPPNNDMSSAAATSDIIRATMTTPSAGAVGVAASNDQPVNSTSSHIENSADNGACGDTPPLFSATAVSIASIFSSSSSPPPPLSSLFPSLPVAGSNHNYHHNQQQQQYLSHFSTSLALSATSASGSPNYSGILPPHQLNNAQLTASPFLLPLSSSSSCSMPISTTATMTSAATMGGRMDINKGHHIFVGNLSNSLEDEELKAAFVRFGSMLDAKIVRYQDQRSRGYAFVVFERREDAARAIKEMDRAVIKKRAVHCNWATRNSQATAAQQQQQLVTGNGMFGGGASGPGNGAATSPTLSGGTNALQMLFQQQNQPHHGSGNESQSQNPTPQRQYKAKPYEIVYSESPLTNTNVYVGLTGATTTGITAGTSTANGSGVQLSDELIRQHFDEFGAITAIKVFQDKGYAFVHFTSHEAAARAISQRHGFLLNGQPIKCWWGKENFEFPQLSGSTAGPPFRGGQHHNNHHHLQNHNNHQHHQIHHQQQQQQHHHHQYNNSPSHLFSSHAQHNQQQFGFGGGPNKHQHFASSPSHQSQPQSQSSSSATAAGIPGVMMNNGGGGEMLFDQFASINQYVQQQQGTDLDNQKLYMQYYKQCHQYYQEYYAQFLSSSQASDAAHAATQQFLQHGSVDASVTQNLSGSPPPAPLASGSAPFHQQHSPSYSGPSLTQQHTQQMTQQQHGKRATSPSNTASMMQFNSFSLMNQMPAGNMAASGGDANSTVAAMEMFSSTPSPPPPTTLQQHTYDALLNYQHQQQQHSNTTGVGMMRSGGGSSADQFDQLLHGNSAGSATHYASGSAAQPGGGAAAAGSGASGGGVDYNQIMQMLYQQQQQPPPQQLLATHTPHASPPPIPSASIESHLSASAAMMMQQQPHQAHHLQQQHQNSQLPMSDRVDNEDGVTTLANNNANKYIAGSDSAVAASDAVV